MTVPERMSTGGIKAPAAWVMGVIAKKRGLAGQSKSAICIITMATITRWLCNTPFGLPVVPPV